MMRSRRDSVAFSSGGFSWAIAHEDRFEVEIGLAADMSRPAVNAILSLEEAKRVHDLLGREIRIAELAQTIAELEADLADPHRYFARRIMPRAIEYLENKRNAE